LALLRLFPMLSRRVREGETSGVWRQTGESAKALYEPVYMKLHVGVAEAR
jgi:hypothetical protein